MIGLLKKDGLVLMRAMRWLVLFIAVMLFLPGMQAFSVVYLSIMTITTISYDEQSKWGLLARMMPYSPFDMVFEKYLFGYLSGLAGVLLGIFSMVLTGFIQKVPMSTEDLLGILLTFFFGQIFIGIDLPLIFRFGAAKTRIVTLVLCGGLAGFFAGFGEEFLSFLSDEAPISFSTILFIAAAVVVLLHAVGIPLSVRFYKKQTE